MKIVVNACYGGFGLSEEAIKMLDDENYDNEEYRTDLKLIECVETLGERANGIFAELEVIEIPDEATDWEINEYDGLENVIYVLNGKIHYA